MGRILMVVGLVAGLWFWVGADIDPDGYCGAGMPIAVAVTGYDDDLDTSNDEVEISCQRRAKNLVVKGAFFGGALMLVGFVASTRTKAAGS